MSRPTSAADGVALRRNVRQRGGFPVHVVEDAASDRQMEQVGAGEIGLHRDE
jgi:hypothetical protein